MTKGRPPKPIETRRREGGTARKGAVSHRPVPTTLAVAGRPDAAELTPPDDLDERGAAIWTHLVSLLHEADMLDRVDLAAIRLAVVQYVQHDLAWSAVSEDPDVDEFAERLDVTAQILVAQRVRIAQALQRGDDVPSREIDGLIKAEFKLANGREYVRLRKVVGAMVALGSTGQVVEHPLVGTGRAAAALFLRFAEQFGGTTLGRTRIQLGKAAGRRLEADLEDALGKGRKRKSA